VFQAPPQLPLDLDEGYPASFIRKPDDAASARVGTIAEAAARGAANSNGGGGVDWAHVNVVTFRNNMNKLLLTPLNARDAWAIDGCVVVRMFNVCCD
jgi:RAT1-interacting protein